MTQTTKKIGVWALVALMLLYSACGAKPAASGSKELTVWVVHSDTSTKSHTLNTEADTLGAALLEAGLVEGEQGEYGLFITAVDGETADMNAEEWWSITKDNEPLITGADSTPIADGEVYELVFMIGW
jgi:hypothetical protein